MYYFVSFIFHYHSLIMIYFFVCVCGTCGSCVGGLGGVCVVNG